jgi:hypothetical protein
VIYLLLSSLSERVPIFNVFRYITFRALMAAMLALAIAFVFGPVLLRVLRAGQVGQPVSQFAPQGHAAKQGTPTMGGVLILASLLLAVLAFADVTNLYVLLTTGVLLGYGLVGAYDDYQKVTRGKNAGVSARIKLLWQFGIALAAISVLYGTAGYDTTLSVPFFKNLERRESHGRSRRARDRAGHDHRSHLRHPRLPRRSRPPRAVSVRDTGARRRRARDRVRGDGDGEPRLSLVQHLSGADVHG